MAVNKESDERTMMSVAGQLNSKKSFADKQLTSGMRRQAQHRMISAISLSGLCFPIAIGPIMMLYANDVLNFSPAQISGVLASLPLVALLRLALLGRIRKLGLVRTASFSGMAVAVMLGLLIAIPADWLDAKVNIFPFMFLIICLSAGIHVGMFSVQQPLIRSITTASDRGHFFGKMRTVWMSLNALVMISLPLFVGENITEFQYKALLVIATIGMLNYAFWTRLLPEPISEPDNQKDRRNRGGRRLLEIIKKSSLLQRPLLIGFFLTIVLVPVYVIYLRRVLNVPTGFVTLFIAAGTFGSAASVLLWGKIADTIGFRPMLGGLLLINIALVPLQLLLKPFPPDTVMVWTKLDLPQSITLLILLIIGLAGGALMAGQNMAITTIQHHHVTNRDSLEAMNIWSLTLMLVSAGVSIFHGLFLEHVVMNGQGLGATSLSFFNNSLHFDWMKGFVLFVGVPLKLITLWQLFKLPNTKPHFGVSHFFSSLSSGALRSSLASRLVFHDDEGRRAEVAHWLGDNTNPMNIGPLTSLMTDPSYDVKMATIRSLARTKSPLAGEQLLELLNDPKKGNLADHVAWALGELEFLPATESLINCLAADRPTRLRAMAARALGKIGNPAAIEALAKLLKSKPASQHLQASTCRSLIRLKAIDHFESVYDTLEAMDERDERFELADALCYTLEITHRWVIASDFNTLTESLLAYVASQPPAWSEEHADLIAALASRNFGAVKHFMSIAATHPSYADSRRIYHLRNSLEKTFDWQAVTVMAAAWILLGKPDSDHR
jgi:MFS family permease